MSKYSELDETTGTVLRWKPKGSNHLLYHIREVDQAGTKKIRGGAPVCCPIFGKMPHTPDYAGINLPQHGLVRLGGPDCQRDYFERPDGTRFMEFLFLAPWLHKVWVSIKTDDHGRTLKHRISVHYLGDNGSSMPLSLGWHPYFATNGKNYSIVHGDEKLTSEELVEGRSIFLKLQPDTPLYLVFNDGHKIEVRLGGDYERFCIWTDAKDKYICVEPVMGGNGKYRRLRPHDAPIHCDCTLRLLG